MASTVTSQRTAYTYQSPADEPAEQDDIDRELDWLIQKGDQKTDDPAAQREQPDLPPRPAIGDFYDTFDDEDVIPNDYDIYDFKGSQTDDEKLRSIGYDPEELEREGKKEEILRTIKTGERNFIQGKQESHQTQFIDMNERLKEVNEQLKRDSSPVEGERRRTIGFKEKLVEVSAAPPDSSEDEEEGPGPGGDSTYVPSTPADSQDKTDRVTTPSAQGDAGQQQQLQQQQQKQQQATPPKQELQRQQSWADSSEDEADAAAEQRRVMAAVRQDRQEKARQERPDPFATSGNHLQQHGGSSDSVVSDDDVDDDVDRKSSAAPSSIGSRGVTFSANGPASSPPPPPAENKPRDGHDPSSTTIQGSGRGSGKKEKVLIEREGTFELVSADDVTARDLGLLPPMPSEEEEKDEQQQQKKEEEEAQPHHVPKPPPGRPASATVAQNNKVHQSQRSWSAQPRSRSQERRGWDSDNFNYRSPYGLSDDQKKELSKQKKTRAEREKLEAKRKQRETDYLQEEATGAFDAWLKKKRRDQRDQRKQESEEERLQREQEQKEKENTKNGTENEKQEEGMDHKGWSKKKRHERRRTRSQDREQQQEMDNSFFLRSREDCDKAFKRWLRSKDAESRRKKTALATNARLSVLAQRRCRKSQQLASAIRQAQAFRYVDYYGYRN